MLNYVNYFIRGARNSAPSIIIEHQIQHMIFSVESDDKFKWHMWLRTDRIQTDRFAFETNPGFKMGYLAYKWKSNSKRHVWRTIENMLAKSYLEKSAHNRCRLRVTHSVSFAE